MKKYLSKIAIVLIISSILMCMFNVKFWRQEGRVIAWDIISYYGYLPATFIYNDLTLKFVDDYKGEHKFTIWYDTAPNGGRVFQITMGMAILYSPFFAAAHLYALLFDYDSGGYSLPYRFGLLMSSVFYLIFGLIYLRKTLLLFYNEIVTSLTLIAVTIGTNLFYYSTFEANMTHAYNFSLIAIFIYYSIRWHEKPNFRLSIIIGLLVGFIVLIRPTNLLIVLFLLLYKVSSFAALGERILFFLKKYQLVALMIVCALAVWIPQLLYWKAITGNWLYYSYGSDQRFFFDNPHILYGLFSYRKGWLLYTPIMFFALIGIAFLWKRNRDFFLPILIFKLLNIYILLSWWSWWYGGGFGLRAFIDSYSLLVIPFAAFLSWIFEQKLWLKTSLLVIYTAFFFQGIFYTVQYYYGAIHWDSMCKAAYWDSFWRVRPSGNFYNLVEPPNYEKARKGIQSVND